MKPVITVTLNPAIDVSTTVERIEPAVKLRCGPARRDAGGGGVNVARVIHRLGGATTAILPAGGLTGRHLIALLEAEGVPLTAVQIAGETREDFTVVERATGREYRFVLEGPHLGWAEWRACLEAAVQPGDEPAIIVASGSLPPGAPPDFHLRLATAARAAGSRTVLDLSGPALAAALGQGIYLIKPNLRELQELTGAALDSDAERLATLRGLVARGDAEIVALTLGDEGAMLVTADQAWRARPLPVSPVSTVGAGDSFLGGMVHALAAGQDLETAFRQGMACGAAALLSPGTGLCDAATAQGLAPHVELEAL